MKSRNSKLVYSTDIGRIKESDEPATDVALLDGIVRVRRETKGRGGKTVSTITGVPLTGNELKLLAKQLKQRCGVGGGVKQGVIEIQGDHCDLLMLELTKQGYTVKCSGG